MEPLTCLVFRPWLPTSQVGCSGKAACGSIAHCRLGLGCEGACSSFEGCSRNTEGTHAGKARLTRASEGLRACPQQAALPVGQGSAADECASHVKQAAASREACAARPPTPVIVSQSSTSACTSSA